MNRITKGKGSQPTKRKLTTGFPRIRRLTEAERLLIYHPSCGSPLISGAFDGLAAAARSMILLICLTIRSSVFHTFHSPIPMPVASGSSIPVLFLYCISLSTKSPALKWISLSPTRRRIATRIWTVFGLIPEPGRIVIGSAGVIRGCEFATGIELDEFVLECQGRTRVREWKCWIVSLWRSERIERDEGDVAIFPWPLEFAD